MVKFLPLIKNDGEAWGVRSSNESMFMHSPQGEAAFRGESQDRSPLPLNPLLSRGTALIKQRLTFQQSLLKTPRYCCTSTKTPIIIVSAVHSEAPMSGRMPEKSDKVTSPPPG